MGRNAHDALHSFDISHTARNLHEFEGRKWCHGETDASDFAGGDGVCEWIDVAFKEQQHVLQRHALQLHAELTRKLEDGMQKIEVAQQSLEARFLEFMCHFQQSESEPPLVHQGNSTSGTVIGAMSLLTTVDDHERERVDAHSVASWFRHTVTPNEKPILHTGSRLRDFVSGPLDSIVGVLIILNSLCMFIQLQFQGFKGGVKLGLEVDSGVHAWDKSKSLFLFLEHAFNLLFVMELLAKLYVFRWTFIRDLTNVFDALIVLATSLDVYVFTPTGFATGANVTFVRMVRTVRIIRTLRLARTMRLFRQLHVLVGTVLSSFMALIWSMVLLGICMIISAIFLCQALRPFVLDEDEDEDARKWVYEHYGTSFKSLYTMFEVTFSGGWPNYARPLVEHVSWWYRLYFLFYVSTVVFAMIRIITALFLKETMEAATADAEFMIAETLRDKEKYAKKLRQLFEAVDEEGTGKVPLETFKQVLGDPAARSYLQMLELEVQDIANLYNVLDDGDGHLTYDEFTTGVMKLRGQARAYDVITILHATQRIEHLLRHRMELLLDRILQRTDRVPYPFLADPIQTKASSASLATESKVPNITITRLDPVVSSELAPVARSTRRSSGSLCTPITPAPSGQVSHKCSFASSCCSVAEAPDEKAFADDVQSESSSNLVVAL